jgi:hypothetical protein
MKRAVEMTGHGRRGKPKAGFPRTPTALGNRCAIPTFPPPRRAMEKWKTRNRFPTFPLHTISCFHLNSERRPGGGAALLLQAHRSIRKCSPADGAAISMAPRHKVSSPGRNRGGTPPESSKCSIGSDDWSAHRVPCIYRVCAYRTGESLKDRAANAKFPSCT